MYLSGTGAPTALVPTGITKDAPAEITVAATTGLAENDIVTFKNTGFPELDGKSFPITNITGTTFEALGSDTTGSTGTLGATPEANVLTAANMTMLCLASVAINREQGEVISVATFCDNTATVPGAAASAGTIDLGLYHDKDSAGFKALLEAEEDGKVRTLVIVFPDDQGTIIATGTISMMAMTDLPLSGAPMWSANMVLSTKPVLRF